MNTTFKIVLTTILSLISLSGWTQKQDKKVIEFSVARTINAPAATVWKVVGEEFGAIYKSHPKIVNSYYLSEHNSGAENATRRCNFNAKGSKYLEETQINYDPENFTYKILINKAKGIPLNVKYSYGIYKVVPIDDYSSKLIMTMVVRTKPALLGHLAKGTFKQDIADYLLAVHHHVINHETVTKANFKTIKKKYNTK